MNRRHDEAGGAVSAAFSSSAYLPARARADVWRPITRRLASRSFPVKRFPARWNSGTQNPGVSRRIAQRAQLHFRQAGYARMLRELIPGA